MTAQYTRFVPFDKARPIPSDDDKDEAARIIAKHGGHSDPEKNAERVASMARIVAQKRIEDELTRPIEDGERVTNMEDLAA